MATVLEDVQKRMAELLARREADLAAIQARQEDARANLAAAAQEMAAATEAMDLQAFEAAKAAQEKAQTLSDMLEKRHAQLMRKDFVTEESSDATVDALLEYEQQLARDFRGKLADPLRRLDKLLTAYMDEVLNCENTLTAWQQNVHANFRTRGRTLYHDPVTGELTDRCEYAQPVHPFVYQGCSEAEQLRAYLKSAADIYAE